MTQFNSNTFEHDYIIKMLESFSSEMDLSDREPIQTLDKYAVALTAFMNGQITEAIRKMNTTPS